MKLTRIPQHRPDGMPFITHEGWPVVQTGPVVSMSHEPRTAHARRFCWRFEYHYRHLGHPRHNGPNAEGVGTGVVYLIEAFNLRQAESDAAYLLYTWNLMSPSVWQYSATSFSPNLETIPHA